MTRWGFGWGMGGEGSEGGEGGEGGLIAEHKHAMNMKEYSARKDE